uniref:hypothetical protein n=1 Tax=Gluconobacter thailandicus TaxID=257438 RepID=UPI000B016FA8|nr:hypothetical protein [Gluconobacter thailandicus]
MFFKHNNRKILALINIASFAFFCIILIPISAFSSPLSESVDRLLASENKFNPDEMAPLLCADYQEISPVGDLDTRAQVLSFYAPSNRSAVILEKTVLSDTSINGLPVLTERLHYTLRDPAHIGRETTLIGTWIGKQVKGHMTVCHAQFTIFHPAHGRIPEKPTSADGN